MRNLSLLFFSIILSIPVFSQTLKDDQKAKLDELFNALDQNHLSMGSVFISMDGKEAYSRSYGMSNFRDGKVYPSVSEQTIYRIGSITKVYTAFVIMKLTEEKRLQLSDHLDAYFPALTEAKNNSLEMLLAHKSTLPVFVRVDDLEKLRQAQSFEELIETANKYPKNSDTTKVKYNNLNYIMLGLVAEKITGKPFNTLLQEYLGAVPSSNVYGKTTLLDYQKNEANSFHLENNEWKEDYEIRETPVSDGSGYLVANARSITTFMEALFAGTLIDSATLTQMLPKNSMFGYGLMKSNFDKHIGFGHTGRIEGFTSATSYFPVEKLGVTFLQNGSVYPLNDIMILIGEILFETQEYKLPDFERDTLTSEEEQLLVGEYVNLEEGISVLIDRKKEVFRLRVVQGKGLLNKRIISVYALSPTRLFNPSQGLIFDFSGELENGYLVCNMRVNGAKLPLKRVSFGADKK